MYKKPPLTLLHDPEHDFTPITETVIKGKTMALERLLSEFNINARVVVAETGPVITMFELEFVAGVKVSQIAALAHDMARALDVGAVRIVAPLPGKHTIVIEVPNSEKEKVRMKSMVESSGSKLQRMQIPLYLSKDSSGEALVSDLAEMPHLLIAGTIGSGKSVCINSIIVSVLLTKRPDEVKMILIDPKMVEMTVFNTIPHLMCPIVTETQMAVQILEWATVKMDERYALLAEARVKNIADFNRLGAEEIVERFKLSCAEEEAKIPKRLPYIVIVIDELADLMMTAANEIEAYIVHLAQKSGAVGIHIVLATQRPQASVVTGLIKSNMPTRIGFRVAARMDSRMILDQNGAETLLGEGDMLFLKSGTSDLVRAQGTFVDENEIKRIVKHLKEVTEPQFHPELTQLKKLDTSETVKDELFDDAVRVVLETKHGSVSLLQQRLNIGYPRASRIIAMMAASGILGEYKGSQAREVMMTLKDWEEICKESKQKEAFLELKPMALYFDRTEFSNQQIVEIISILSELYHAVGGDRLVVEGTMQLILEQEFARIGLEMTDEKQKREGIQQVSVRGESGKLWAKRRPELIAAIDDVIKGLLRVPVDSKKGTALGEGVQELTSIGLDGVKAHLKRAIVQNEKDEADIKRIYRKTEHEWVMKDKTQAEIRKLDAESEKMELNNVVQRARLKLKLTKAMIASRPGEEAILFGNEIDAYNPAPVDGATLPNTWAILQWSPGISATSHDVYFGENFADVQAGTGGTFRGNQTGTDFIVGFPGYSYPDGLVPDTTYYWRIDEVEANGTTIHKGNVWSFTFTASG